jgi:tagatose-6-phosphate ketose/aldose isomerase
MCWGSRGGIEERAVTAVQILGMSATEIDAGGAYWTAREIAQQPAQWPLIAQRVTEDASLHEFLRARLFAPRARVLLSGAGTSSFIGECLAPALGRAGLRAQPVPTTDLVTSPLSALVPGDPTVMVHFARSGNSPESVAALDLAEQLAAGCAHLVVTCNAKGELYQRAQGLPHARCLLLPECDDRGFAMTSSFTGMLLAAGLALRVLGAGSSRTDVLAALGTQALSAGVPLLNDLVGAQFERVVYLGSNELKGLAHESALKMLELTDGRVVSAGESPIGFRHGPKTLLNGNTLVVLFLSDAAHTRRYELDVLHELRHDGVAGRVLALSGSPLPDRDALLLEADAPAHGALADLELCLPYIVFAQALAVRRSLSLGLTPDSPNAAGKVHRVVRGVSIYPFRP